MLQIDSVSKLYKGGDKALDNISFSVEQGEFISVIGKSKKFFQRIYEGY